MLTDQNHNFYIFKESYIRLSSEKFDLNLNENFSNKYIHLTNNAVQKNGKDYGLYEDGNILSFNALNEITDDIKVSTNYLMMKMKSCIQMTMQTMGARLDPHRRKYCFEIFGYDFMIDNFGQVWLIEINTNPC